MNIKKGSNYLKSINQALDDYLRNPEIYDLVLINGATKNDFCRLVDYAIMFANGKNQKQKLFLLTKKQKRVINIALPILDAFIIGLAINSITCVPVNQWNIICFCLSIVQMACSIIAQYLINK